MTALRVMVVQKTFDMSLEAMNLAVEITAPQTKEEKILSIMNDINEQITPEYARSLFFGMTISYSHDEKVDHDSDEAFFMQLMFELLNVN